jgi:Beta-propeller repeat
MRGRLFAAAVAVGAVASIGSSAGAATVVSSAVLGGSALDSANAVAVDAAGNIYVAGETASANFPTVGSPRGFAGVSDAFVVKLDPTGTVLFYSTLIGGSEADSATAIGVDAGGNVWITGETLSDDFPTTPDAVLRTPAGASDAFLAKLDPSGAVLLYATRLGGEGFDRGNAIAVGTGGEVAVAGRTGSTSFPVTAGAVQPFQRGGDFDAFVSRFDSTGQLTLSTYLGGAENDAAFGVALDGGAVWIVGGTRSPDFPATSGAYQSTNFATDAFATKLDAAGGFVYSTFLGGSFVDRANAIAVDSAGHAFVAGQAGSPDFPTVNAVQATFGGGANDAFLAELDSSRSGDASLVFSTFLGGSGDDRASGVAIRAVGLSLAGQISTGDAFVARFRTSGAPALIETTVLGGSGNDNANAVTMTPSGDAVAVGRTDSIGFPPVAARFGTGGGTDAFLVRIGEGGPAPSIAVPLVSPRLLALLAGCLAAVGVALLRR